MTDPHTPLTQQIGDGYIKEEVQLKKRGRPKTVKVEELLEDEPVSD